MTKVPEIPENLDTEETVNTYIEQLHDQLDFLEEEIRESEKDKLELQEELEQSKNASFEERSKIIQDIANFLRGVTDNVESHNNTDCPSEESANQLDDITGYDGRNK